MMREGHPFRKTRALGVALRLGFAGAVVADGSAFAQAGGAPGDMPPTGQPETARLLTLPAAEHAALEEQPQLRAARAQTAVAQATAEQLRSPLLPQVTGIAQYGHEWGSFRSLGSAGT